jgi:hypothetical protein
MKFEKWTVGLAAVGALSLACSANAEEKASTVMTALSSTTLSGYVDTSAQWNFGSGNARLPVYKFGGGDKADGFNLNVVQLRLEKPLDEAEWAAGYRVDLWAGPDANTLGTQSTLSTGSSDFAVRQAYAALRMPFGNGIDWKVGVFDSIIGYESVESGNNPNFTRSYGHSIEPQTHTGVLGSYRFNDMISVSAGIANTVSGFNTTSGQFGPIINSRDRIESRKTYMASGAFTAPDTWGFLSGSTLYAGIVNGFNGGYGEIQTSYYLGGTVATGVTGLRFGGALDVFDAKDFGGETWSVAGYGSYQATEKLSLHLRGEFLKDRGDQKFFLVDDGTGTGTLVPGNPNKVMAITATAQYDLWKNVISRLEMRWDHSLSGEKTWGGDDLTVGPSRKNEWLLAANLIYKF